MLEVRLEAHETACDKELYTTRAHWTLRWLPCLRCLSIQHGFWKLGGDIKCSRRELECTGSS